MFLPVVHISAECRGQGVYFFSSLVSKRRLMAFLHFSEVKWQCDVPELWLSCLIAPASAFLSMLIIRDYSF